MIKLYPEQEDIIKQIYYYWGAGGNKHPQKSILLNAGTGVGKTIISSYIASDALSRGLTVWFLVHNEKLVNQTVEKMASFGIEAGIIQASRPLNLHLPVQIASLKTLEERDLYGLWTRKQINFQDFWPRDGLGLLIVDECHTTSFYKGYVKTRDYFSPSPMWQKGNDHPPDHHTNQPCWALSKLKVLGLTATAIRTNPKEGFCTDFTAVVEGPPTADLISNGVLKNGRRFAFDCLQKNELRVNEDGEYTSSSIKVVCNEEYNDYVIKKWLELARDRKTIIFCGNGDQLNDMLQKFIILGFSAEAITYNTSNSERDLIYQRYATGETQILISIDVLTAGFDETSVNCVVLASPTKSLAKHRQRIGRGARKHEGQVDFFILDFNAVDLGNFDDPFDIFLCPRWKPPKNKRDMPLVNCPRCQHEHLAIIRRCPQCGYEEDTYQPPALNLGSNFGEVFSKETLEQKSHFQRQFRTWYTKHSKGPEHYAKNPHPFKVKWKFREWASKKYGSEQAFFPIDRWYYGLLFNGMNPGINQLIYKKVLIDVLTYKGYKGVTLQHEVNKWLKLEFQGCEDQVNLLLKPVKDNLESCYGVLGLTPGASYEQAQNAYDQTSEILEEQFKTGIISEEQYLTFYDAMNYVLNKAKDELIRDINPSEMYMV